MRRTERRARREHAPRSAAAICASASRAFVAVVAVVGVALLLASGSARAIAPPEEEEPAVDETPAPPYAGTNLPDDHDPLRAAHPVRIVALVLHPVGVALDWIVVRPAVWAARHEPLKTIFGYQD